MDQIFDGLTDCKRVFTFRPEGNSLVSIWKCFDPEWDNFKYILVCTENKKANVFDDVDSLLFALQGVFEAQSIARA